jgi:hypothetical protein
MQLEDTAKLIEAVAKLVGALAWPAVVVFALSLLGPSIGRFLATLSEVRLKGRGFEASAVRRLDFDATSQKLYDFWKPGGKIDRANAARITTCMTQLGIVGSVAWLINAGTPEQRARVAACLSIEC